VSPLALRELLSNLRLWLAAGPLLALTAALTTITFSMRSLNQALAEDEVGLMDQYDATLLALVLLAGLAATTVSVYQVAQRTRRRVANLAIAGLTPSGASTRFSHQVMGVAAVAAAVGICVGWATAPVAMRFIAWASSGHAGLEGRTDAHAILGSFVITLGLALIGATQGASQARSVEPIEALKDRPFQPRKGSRRRLWLAGAGGAGAALTAVLTAVLPGLESLRYRPLEAANITATCAGTTTALLAIFFWAAAPAYCPLLIRAWTVFLPRHRLPALSLGRSGAAFQARRSLEAFNLILVGALLAGSTLSIYFARSALDTAGRGWVAARDVSGVVLAGVPVLVVLTGSVLTVVVTARSRVDEARVLRLSGATGRQVLLAGFTEAFILAVTATLVAMIGVAIVGLTTGIGLAQVATAPDWPATLGFDPVAWMAPLGVMVAGMALVTAVALPTLARGLRQPLF
jgi:predicted lysophospholipase L1 biosynthesis ABC-type transport system permease subunit